MICEEGDFDFKKDDNIGNEDIASLVIGDDESFGGDDNNMTEDKQMGMFDDFPEICNESNQTPTVSVCMPSPVVENKTPLQLSIENKITPRITSPVYQSILPASILVTQKS